MHFSGPTYSENENTCTFEAMADLGCFSSTVTRFWNAAHIQKFLKQTRFKPCEPGHDGITWFEMYILYRLWGGPDGIKDTARTSKAPACMRSQVRNFKMCLKEVAALTMETKDKDYFKPSSNKKARLRGMGIDTYLAMTSFRVAITEEAKTALAKEILKSQTRRAPNELEAILQKKQPIMCTKYRDAGRVAWLKNLKPLEKQIFYEDEHEDQEDNKKMTECVKNKASEEEKEARPETRGSKSLRAQ